jgi:hypothetical protein
MRHFLNSLRTYNGDILSDWNIYSAIVTPDLGNLVSYYTQIGKLNFKPCENCLFFVITQETNLGRL